MPDKAEIRSPPTDFTRIYYAGMRPDTQGLGWAEAILKLRSLKVSGDLAGYLEFHLKQEHRPGCP